MVYYFHTKSYIFAVTNGYCSSVMYADGEEFPIVIVGAKLVGGIWTYFGSDEPVPAENIEVGMRLKFEHGPASLTSDRVENIQIVSSLSIPPGSRISAIPETIKIRGSIPTLPESFFSEYRDDKKTF